VPDTPKKLREQIARLDELLEEAARLKTDIEEHFRRLHRDDRSTVPRTSGCGRGNDRST
jgi:hypothetical protein